MSKYKNNLFFDLYFIFSSAFILMLLQTLLRGVLLWRNNDLAASIPSHDLIHAFLTGLRFDLIVTVYALLPLIIGLLFKKGLSNRKAYTVWLTFVSSVMIFLAIIELDFYHEFHTRLNSLVFEYMKEDPATVLSMIWYGFPVVTYLIIIGLMITALFFIFTVNSRINQAKSTDKTRYSLRMTAFLVVLLISVVAARGTLRQGPPLRWGDAFQSNYLFANHLGLNGVYTLAKAVIGTKKGDNKWLKKMPLADADSTVEEMILTPSDQLIDPEYSPVLRSYHARVGLTQKPLNVVFILMESFSGEYVGALGHDEGITPEFDKLAKQGLLFNRFFSNGTHTHQGMFTSLACFPNLPHYEYLMQQPEGSNHFSGLIQMTADRGYQSMYIYNGDFAWDNQKGFFGAQGMQHFIGRHDFVNPVFSDPTWGVSDQDMFDRATEELQKMPKDKPFFAFLQTLSNHTPYALPTPLPVEKVTGHGELNEHLTAMRYADWALGQFFKKVMKSDYVDNTLFVLVGDHGFSSPNQVTDIDMLKFHVPLLIIGPDVVKKYGHTNSTVGAQVDIAPTVAGLMGGDTTYNCWGRDLLNINDAGFAVIKPSGSDPTTAIIDDNKVLVKSTDNNATLYNYELLPKASANTLHDAVGTEKLEHRLDAYIVSATSTLLRGKAGIKTPDNRVAVN
ncbi:MULTISPECIES: LTA synthase family protein [unclassified Methylophaga]|jgi:phosphoglycerol transferase MdoB-like AlkP superfamily enzyme|uniref:LTA synthase family protein n=1 Tax=unclassified Methylophaga TaxID=2629249 RepID=UPI00259D1EE6|nr:MULTISPECIES: LTA synthase family protein [unclassified Methylophaga]|tara:strand:- start:769 stop:2790 length:2022 start_codon:yes stop_codon:yes gene_type:complete